MISIHNLSDFYAHNLEIIKMQTEGLTHLESLIQLPFRSNCLNWVVGHLVANRCNILALLGADDLRPQVDLDHYERESDPVLGEGEGVLPLEELLMHLEESQTRLAAALERKVKNPSSVWPHTATGPKERSATGCSFYTSTILIMWAKPRSCARQLEKMTRSSNILKTRNGFQKGNRFFYLTI